MHLIFDFSENTCIRSALLVQKIARDFQIPSNETLPQSSIIGLEYHPEQIYFTLKVQNTKKQHSADCC